MEKILPQTKFFVPLGLVLVVISYLLAGGYDRAVPVHDAIHGCKFGAANPLTFIMPHGRIENYSHYELLGCLPPHYFLLYALALLGIVMCAWGLVATGKRFFNHEKIQSEDFLNGLVVLVSSPLMILVGVWMLHLQISIGFGGGIYTLGDFFDIVSEALVIIGLLGIISAIILAFVAESKGKTIS